MAEVNWSEIRLNYPLIAKEGAYLSTSFCGAMSNQTVQVQKDCLDVIQLNGNEVQGDADEAANRIRDNFITILNAKEFESAIIPDVSTAMNVMAETMTGKKIALLEDDFPTVTVPWVVREYDIEWINKAELTYSLDEIESAIQGDIEVLALSWVMYNSGVRLDLKKIGDLCKDNGVILIVDATQGLGPNALNLSEVYVDVLFASCFKWFLSGFGVGIALARKDFLDKYPIKAAGHNSVLSAQSSVTDLSNIRTGLRRLEVGHIKSQQVLALDSALTELMSIGMSEIQYRTQDLMDYFVNEISKTRHKVLTPIPYSANIVMIKGSQEMSDRLNENKIKVTYRYGYIRLGIYFYNNREDIDQFIKTISVISE